MALSESSGPASRKSPLKTRALLRARHPQIGRAEFEDAMALLRRLSRRRR
jgi:hypothetical protein